MNEQSQCAHEWRKLTDWQGDPDIPNGTQTWTFYKCIACDLEQDKTPDDYDSDL